LHQNNIIHRDIKPENILIGENNELKLCDFGWAKVLTMETRQTFCGTMEYMAPEIVGSEKYDFGVDTWSLGILLYELLMGHSPFRAKKDKNIMLKIKLHDLALDKSKLSNDCINLISGLLDPNPLNRLKIKDILVHPFITSNSKKGGNIKNGIRKESNDDSNENALRFLNGKKKNFTEKFNNLRKKFGFESTLNIKDKLSSKNLIEFKSDKNIVSVKTFNFKDKNLRNESKILDKLKDNMTNQLEKAKKKFVNFNFKSEKQLSFEDFRDNSNLLDNSKVRDTHETSNFENTLENEGERNNSFESIDEEDSNS
jgi:serine/threonine protein kinase